MKFFRYGHGNSFISDLSLKIAVAFDKGIRASRAALHRLKIY